MTELTINTFRATVARIGIFASSPAVLKAAVLGTAAIDTDDEGIATIEDVDTDEITGGTYARVALTGVALDLSGPKPALVADDLDFEGLDVEDPDAVGSVVIYDDTSRALVVLIRITTPVAVTGNLAVQFPGGHIAEITEVAPGTDGGSFTGTDFQAITGAPSHAEAFTFQDNDAGPGISLASIGDLVGEASSILVEVALTDTLPTSPDDVGLSYTDLGGDDPPGWGIGYVVRATLEGTRYGTVVLALWADPAGVHGVDPGGTAVWAYATDDIPPIGDPEWIASGFYVFPPYGADWPYNVNLGGRPVHAAYQMAVNAIVPASTFTLTLVPLAGRQTLPVLIQGAGGPWSDVDLFVFDTDGNPVTVLDPFDVASSVDDDLYLEFRPFVDADGHQSWIGRMVPALTLT